MMKKKPTMLRCLIGFHKWIYEDHGRFSKYRQCFWCRKRQLFHEGTFIGLIDEWVNDAGTDEDGR